MKILSAKLDHIMSIFSSDNHSCPLVDPWVSLYLTLAMIPYLRYAHSSRAHLLKFNPPNNTMKTSNQALRPYLESIEKQCQLLNRDDLIHLIQALAKQIDPGQRHNFPATVHAELPAKDTQTEVPKTTSTGLPAEIKALHDSIHSNRSPAPHLRSSRPLRITNYSSGACSNEPGALD